MPSVLTVTQGGYCYDLLIPLWTNNKLNDVISKNTGQTLSYGGKAHVDTPINFNRKRPPTIAINMYHLLVTLMFLTHSGSFDNYNELMGQNIISFMSVARFLGAPSILVYLASRIVNSFNIALFRVHLWKYLFPDKHEFTSYINIIRTQNVNLIGEGFDLESLQILFHANVPNRQLCSLRRKNVVESHYFWQSQDRYDCGFCGTFLYPFLVNVKDTLVDITDCCQSLVCKICWGEFLFSSHTCIHIPKCTGILHCFAKTSPFSVKMTAPIRYCPICEGGYWRGFFSWRYCNRDEDRKLKIRRIRQRQLMNVMRLLGKTRSYYLAPTLRDFVSTVYDFGHYVLSDPYDEIFAGCVQERVSNRKLWEGLVKERNKKN